MDRLFICSAFASAAMLAGCSSDSGGWKKPSGPAKDGESGPLVTDTPMQDQFWYRGLDAQLTLGVDKLRELEGIGLDARLKTPVHDLSASYSDYAKRLRDAYSAAYSGSVTDYSAGSGTSQERSGIRRSRYELSRLADTHTLAAESVKTLAMAFEKNPSERSFDRLQQAVVDIFRMTKEDGLSADDPSSVPSAGRVSRQSSGRDSFSQLAPGNGGQVQQVGATGDGRTTTVQQRDNGSVHITNVYVVASVEELKKLGVRPQDIKPEAILTMIEEGRKPYLGKGKVNPTVGWKLTPDGKGYIAIPFQPSADTRITGNFDARPFSDRQRRVRLELGNVRSEDSKRFRAHVKSDVRLGFDGDRQGDDTINPGAGDEFVIDHKAGKDTAYYLAWRVEGMSRREFQTRNPNAVIVLRLLD